MRRSLVSIALQQVLPKYVVTYVSYASNKIVGFAENIDAGPLHDVPKANGSVIGGRRSYGPVELNTGHTSVVARESQYHIAHVYVPDDYTRILKRKKF